MVNFLLGLFVTSTILLFIFILKFYDFSSLKKEKVLKKDKKEKDLNMSDDIDLNDFFR